MTINFNNAIDFSLITLIISRFYVLCTDFLRLYSFELFIISVDIFIIYLLSVDIMYTVQKSWVCLNNSYLFILNMFIFYTFFFRKRFAKLSWCRVCEFFCFKETIRQNRSWEQHVFWFLNSSNCSSVRGKCLIRSIDLSIENENQRVLTAAVNVHRQKCKHNSCKFNRAKSKGLINNNPSSTNWAGNSSNFQPVRLQF